MRKNTTGIELFHNITNEVITNAMNEPPKRSKLTDRVSDTVKLHFVGLAVKLTGELSE